MMPEFAGQAERYIGPRSEPVSYTPPKYGPPPGYPMEKWRTMNRKQRRAILKSLTSAVNQAANTTGPTC